MDIKVAFDNLIKVLEKEEAELYKSGSISKHEVVADALRKVEEAREIYNYVT